MIILLIILCLELLGLEIWIHAPRTFSNYLICGALGLVAIIIYQNLAGAGLDPASPGYVPLATLPAVHPAKFLVPTRI